MKYRFILLILMLMILTACEVNNLRSIEEHYEKARYAASIQEADQFIPKGSNGAFVTRAELVRANSYLELGKIAISRNMKELAIKFFKLSNSVQADQELVKIYKDEILAAIPNSDYETQLFYINSIIREVPDSDAVPEMLQRRLTIYEDWKGDSDGAWLDYMDLYDRFAGNTYEVAARKTIQRVTPGRIAYGRRLSEAGYYNEALTIFFELAKYPVVESAVINDLIGNTYRAQAEAYLQLQNYMEADRFLRIALQYIPDQAEQIQARLREIVGFFIKKGDSYVAERNFDAALAQYQRVFEIIPDYEPAQQAIQRMNTTRENIARAAQLFAQAERTEASGKVADALKLFQQANALDSNPETLNRISIAQNILEADRNPQAFAQRIVAEYRGGLLNNRISQQKKALLQIYKSNEIRDSGWKFLLSTSQYKYEVRYDLMTPRENYFYIWQVNLKDRRIIPLNKISEELMK